MLLVRLLLSRRDFYRDVRMGGCPWFFLCRLPILTVTKEGLRGGEIVAPGVARMRMVDRESVAVRVLFLETR